MTVKQIKDFIEDYFKSDLSIKSRKYEMVRLRFAYYHYAYNYSSEITSYQHIGNLVGFSSHATVLHGLKEHDNILRSDIQWRKIIAEMESVLLPKIKASKIICNYAENNTMKIELINRRLKHLKRVKSELIN